MSSFEHIDTLVAKIEIRQILKKYCRKDYNDTDRLIRMLEYYKTDPEGTHLERVDDSSILYQIKVENRDIDFDQLMSDGSKFFKTYSNNIQYSFKSDAREEAIKICSRIGLDDNSLYAVDYIAHAGSHGRYYTFKIYWRNTI